MGIVLAALFKLRIGIAILGKSLQVIHHGVAHRVGERCLFTVQDIMGQIIALESVSQQVLALAVDVDLLGRVDGQYIADKVQIAKGYTGLQRVDGDAAVGAEHIIHV